MGGIVTFIQRGTEGMREMGLKGGRPRLKTIEEIASQARAQAERERGNGRPPSSAIGLPKEIAAALGLIKRRGSGRPARLCSPEGAGLDRI